MRFLAQVWKLILENPGDINDGHPSLIEAKPPDESDVRDVMPHYRAGLAALIVADYLDKPSWQLLSHVLARVENYGASVAEQTVVKVRKTLALFPDSEQPAAPPCTTGPRTHQDPGNVPRVF